MSKKKNGFTMIEVLVASTIFLQIITIFLPIYSKIETNKVVLTERRNAAFTLSEEMQTITQKEPPLINISYDKIRNETVFHFIFNEENNLIKGCVTWTNAKRSEERFCLYGLPKE